MSTKRIEQIDFFRGIAILLMIIYHILVDLNMFYGMDIHFNDYPLKIVGRLSAIMFIYISGMCTILSKNNTKNGIKVFIFALALTFITFILFKEEYIIFGILHLIGFGILTANIIKKINKKLLFILGLSIIYIGNVFDTIILGTNLFVPLGITSGNFLSLDYFPIFPWFGIFIIGISLSKKSINIINRINIPNFFSPICFIGKNSLFIYLMHQPIILAILYVLFNLI